MSRTTAVKRELSSPPEFKTNAAGAAAVVKLKPAAYVTLLVRANVTDPSVWPPGMQDGAAALARVRDIERKCIAKHGAFDWGKLSAKVQDEYDGLCALLDRLQETGKKISLESYKARRSRNGR